MPFIKANGINLYYETHGSGSPLFLIGGYAQHTEVWKEYLDPLAQHFSVTAFDNRGAGQSETPEDAYSIKMMAEDTVGLMDELNIESAHFLGQSMGTLIIQQLCLNHPDRVKKGILCAPFSQMPPTAKQHFQTMLRLFPQLLTQEQYIELNVPWMLSNAFLSIPGNAKSFIEVMLSNPYPQSTQGALAQADALFTCDLRHEIHKIPHEILLLVGGEDLLTHPACASLMQQKIPSCKLHTFKEMGHAFPLEIPKQVIKHTLEFLLQ